LNETQTVQGQHAVNTYINLRENIYKSTVVIGRPTKCLEHPKPLWTQSIAAGGQLRTQAWNVIQPARDYAVYKTVNATSCASKSLGTWGIQQLLL